MLMICCFDLLSSRADAVLVCAWKHLERVFFLINTHVCLPSSFDLYFCFWITRKCIRLRCVFFSFLSCFGCHSNILIYWYVYVCAVHWSNTIAFFSCYSIISDEELDWRQTSNVYIYKYVFRGIIFRSI